MLPGLRLFCMAVFLPEGCCDSNPPIPSRPGTEVTLLVPEWKGPDATLSGPFLMTIMVPAYGPTSSGIWDRKYRGKIRYEPCIPTRVNA